MSLAWPSVEGTESSMMVAPLELKWTDGGCYLLAFAAESMYPYLRTLSHWR